LEADPVNVIETRGLTKIFRDFWGRRKVVAVRDLKLEIHRGEVFGLLGPNGSGKSTTVKMLLGLLFPTRGEIAVLGRPPRDVAAKRLVGFLPEESYLYRFLNADETLDFYGRLFGLSRAERKRRSEVLIRQVGLDHARRRPLKEYSKGMARRIGVAQALINDPALVILDEPTSGLDPKGRREMKDLVLALKAQGKTVLLCSHLLPDVEEICDRIGILNRGRLLTAGRLSDLLVRRDEIQIRAKNVQADLLDDFRAKAAEQNGEILSMSEATDTLEQVFLELTGGESDEHDPAGSPAGDPASEAARGGATPEADSAETAATPGGD